MRSPLSVLGHSGLAQGPGTFRTCEAYKPEKEGHPCQRRALALQARGLPSCLLSFSQNSGLQNCRNPPGLQASGQLCSRHSQGTRQVLALSTNFLEGPTSFCPRDPGESRIPVRSQHSHSPPRASPSCLRNPE